MPKSLSSSSSRRSSEQAELRAATAGEELLAAFRQNENDSVRVLNLMSGELAEARRAFADTSAEQASRVRQLGETNIVQAAEERRAAGELQRAATYEAVAYEQMQLYEREAQKCKLLCG